MKTNHLILGSSRENHLVGVDGEVVRSSQCLNQTLLSGSCRQEVLSDFTKMSFCCCNGQQSFYSKFYHKHTSLPSIILLHPAAEKTFSSLLRNTLQRGAVFPLLLPPFCPDVNITTSNRVKCKIPYHVYLYSASLLFMSGF